MPGTRPKLMQLAVAMMAAMGIQQQQEGHQLMFKLQNHFRVAGGSKPSRAAHYKRLAKKRAIARARSKK